jgi:hypothetical protein
MSHFTRGIPLFMVATIVACTSATTVRVPEVAPVSVVGCYVVSMGAWSGPHESPNPPTTISLLDSTGTYLLEAGKKLVRPHPVGATMPFNMAWWSRLSPEHLDIVFTSGGEIGVRLHLVWGWGDGSWSGTGVAYTDVSPGVQAVASAKLTPCA